MRCTRSLRFILSLFGGALSAPILAQCPLDKLTAAGAAAEDWFGTSVAVHVDIAVAGAWNHTELGVGVNAGAAYIFERSAAGWLEVLQLTPSDTTAGDRFGGACAVFGDTAIVTAPVHGESGFASGAAYVFERRASGWVETQELTASDAAAGDQFGYSVALEGAWALVGALEDDDGGADSGSAYVFERGAGGWTQVAKLTASDATPGALFGHSIGISGDRVLVSAHRDGIASGAAQGAAYVFEHTPSGWIETQKLTASDAAPGRRFGHNLSLAGGTCVIGDRFGAPGGAAYVFERSPSGWYEVQKLLSPSTQPTFFGWSVSIEGNTILVGDPRDGTAASGAGAVHLFERGVDRWVLRDTVTASDAATGAEFGTSTALSDGTLLVGAWREMAGGANAGAAYVFDARSGRRYCVATANSTGYPASLTVAGCASVAAADFVLVAAPVPNGRSGLFYYGPTTSRVPFGNGFRCVGGAVFRLDVQVSTGERLVHSLDYGNPSAAADSIMGGSTWNFQAWFRDPAGGGAFFNLSDARSVTFEH